MRIQSTLLVLLVSVSVAACRSGSPSSPSPMVGERSAVLAPASASGDLLSMFVPEHEAKWSEARAHLRAFQFYQQNLRSVCPTCGQNSLADFLGVVPGGVFNWLNSRGIAIGVEAGAVKEHTCSGAALAGQLLADIQPIYGSGARVAYVAMDEPFTAGLPAQFESPFGRCNLSVDDVIVQVQAYIEAVRHARPEIEVGLIEPYPYFSVEDLQGFVTGLENAGVRLSFFRLDYDQQHRRNENGNVTADLRNLRAFLRARNIRFEVIVTGVGGRTGTASVASAIALAHEVATAIGSPDVAVFQDFSNAGAFPQSGSLNIPEYEIGTLTWLANSASGVFQR